jgi:superfamily I DNA/RNA helicase
MIFRQDILKGLSAEQEAVCTMRDNIYLTACPGSGKTLVLTRRLAYLTYLNPESRKWNIAITFTNRAADEIANRLDNSHVVFRQVSDCNISENSLMSA